MRGHLRTLAEDGIVERRRQNDFPGNADYELLRPGRELLEVAEVLQAWLQSAPDGPLLLGSAAAKSAIKALLGGWSSTMVRALAARPLSLTELNRLISSLNYPSLERRLAAMRIIGLIEACPGAGRSTPYAASEWLRSAVGPLAAGALWEARAPSRRSAPVNRIDVEATFLLAIPLLSLPPEMSGMCRLAVEIQNGRSEPDLIGATVEVRNGRVVSCVARLLGDAGAWASGSTTGWLRAVIEEETDLLEIGGDCGLATALAEGLHDALFGVRQAR